MGGLLCQATVVDLTSSAEDDDYLVRFMLESVDVLTASGRDFTNLRCRSRACRRLLGS